MKALLLTVALLLGCVTVSSQDKDTGIITVSTNDLSMVFSISPDKKVVYNYFGDKFRDVSLFLHKKYKEQPDNGIGYAPVIYPAYGGRFFLNPALKLTHDDGVQTTELIYAAHQVKNIDNNRKYRCLSEMKVGEAIYLHEEELLESPFVLIKAENHETELGWGKAKAICNTATLVSLTTGKKRTAILYCNNGSISKGALKSIQSQVDDEYNHEAVAWNEPHSRIPVVLKNVQYTHKHNDIYVMTDRKTNEEYEMVPQRWAVPILDKLEYNTIVTIIYYEGKWDFVSKKETVDIGKYKFNIR